MSMMPAETSSDLVRTNLLLKTLSENVSVSLAFVGGEEGRYINCLRDTQQESLLACHAAAELKPPSSLLSLPHAKKQAPHRVKSQVTDGQSSLQIFGQIHKNLTHQRYVQKI